MKGLISTMYVRHESVPPVTVRGRLPAALMSGGTIAQSRTPYTRVRWLPTADLSSDAGAFTSPAC